MGIVYGVDVRDGPGVRGSATSYDDYTWYAPEVPTGGDTPEPSLDRLDAFAQVVNAYAPFTVRELCDDQAVSRPGDSYGPHSADVFDVGMLYVFELCQGWGSVPISFLLADDVTVFASMDAALLVDPPVVRLDELVPMRNAGFEVDDVFVVGGSPVRSGGLRIQVSPTVGVGAVSEIETFPQPASVQVMARFRWLPFSWSLDPWCTWWVPYSGLRPQPCPGLSVQEFRDDLGQCREGVKWKVKDFLAGGAFQIRPATQMSFDSSPGVNPVLLPSYGYYRAGGYVRNAAVSMRRGAHMWTDEVNWNAEEVTVIVVAVVHEPKAEWFGLLETEAPNLQGLDPFFGIRLHRSGTMNLWADSVIASVDVRMGVTRPAQPIVFGLNIDMVNNTFSMLSADRVVKVQTADLPHRYDNRSRLWLGRSPFGQDAAASIDVLDVGYWERRLGPGDLYGLLGDYDRIYGVTSS